MKLFIQILSIVVVLVTFSIMSSSNSYRASSDSRHLSDFLEFQHRILVKIEPTVERIDLARLLVIKKSISILREDLAENRDQNKFQFTLKTTSLIQKLIIQYRFSESFFGWEDEPSILSIHTESTSEMLADLKESYLNLRKKFGYDDSPYTMVTADILKQMKSSLDQIEQLPMEAEVKSELRKVWPLLGSAMAYAEQGDRTCTFFIGTKVTVKLRELYSLFNRISSSSAGYPLILELQGLAEFYAEYAQVDQIEEFGRCKGQKG